tara:strand:- start:3421 stop:4644 length:1224 start_codon:yes stop_codon:yes gene_type:complete
MKICILGLGYVGLPIATLFATKGHDVIGVDINKSIVETLNKGRIHIHEPGLEQKLKQAISLGKLTAKTTPEKADVFILAVPTPLTKEKKADLTYVEKATELILPFIEKGNMVILESTVPPGTTEEIIGKKLAKDILLVHCPERILPGTVLKELTENSRVIGGTSKEASEKAKSLYKSFVEGEIYITTAKTAEFVKLIENTYRDVNIAFANELSLISKKLGLNVREAIQIANQHPRVNIHQPGPGVGGHCIAIDPWFIVEKAQESAKIITLARNTNDNMPLVIAGMAKEMVKGIENPIITILGVAYKADIDDARETPSEDIIKKLKKDGYTIKIHDPYVKEFPYEIIGNIENSVKDSDCIILVTDHQPFKNLNPDSIKSLMRTKNLIDTRNCLDKKAWEKSGFKLKTI